MTELAHVYLPWAQVNHCSYASARSRVTHLCDAFGSLQLREITPMVVDAYISHRATIQMLATVNREVQLLHHGFVKALQWGKALENPLRYQKPLRVNNRRLRCLSHEELARLFDIADDVVAPVLIAALPTRLQ